MVKQDTLRYNLAVYNANVKTMVRFAAAGSSAFKPEIFISALADLEQFPFVSVRELLAAADLADAGIIAKKAGIAEIVRLDRPALILLNRQMHLQYSSEIVQILSTDDDYLTIMNQDCDRILINIAELEKMHLGFVFLHGAVTCNTAGHEFSASFDIEKKGAFALDGVCDRLRDLCEKIGYHHIARCEPSLSSIGGNVAQSNVSYGNALDVTEDRTGVVMAFLEAAASTFGTSVDNIEGLHIRRLYPGEIIPRGFDNGINLQRIKALHVLFGSENSILDFTETCSGRIVELSYGDAVLIDSADRLCRTRWQSGWSAVSRQGDCFIASCWQRWCP